MARSTSRHPPRTPPRFSPVVPTPDFVGDSPDSQLSNLNDFALISPPTTDRKRGQPAAWSRWASATGTGAGVGLGSGMGQGGGSALGLRTNTSGGNGAGAKGGDNGDNGGGEGVHTQMHTYPQGYTPSQPLNVFAYLNQADQRMPSQPINYLYPNISGVYPSQHPPQPHVADWHYADERTGNEFPIYAQSQNRPAAREAGATKKKKKDRPPTGYMFSFHPPSNSSGSADQDSENELYENAGNGVNYPPLPMQATNGTDGPLRSNQPPLVFIPPFPGENLPSERPQAQQPVDPSYQLYYGQPQRVYETQVGGLSPQTDSSSHLVSGSTSPSFNSSEMSSSPAPLDGVLSPLIGFVPQSHILFPVPPETPMAAQSNLDRDQQPQQWRGEHNPGPSHNSYRPPQTQPQTQSQSLPPPQSQPPPNPSTHQSTQPLSSTTPLRPGQFHHKANAPSRTTSTRTQGAAKNPMSPRPGVPRTAALQAADEIGRLLPVPHLHRVPSEEAFNFDPGLPVLGAASPSPSVVTGASSGPGDTGHKRRPSARFIGGFMNGIGGLKRALSGKKAGDPNPNLNPSGSDTHQPPDVGPSMNARPSALRTSHLPHTQPVEGGVDAAPYGQDQPTRPTPSGGTRFELKEPPLSMPEPILMPVPEKTPNSNMDTLPHTPPAAPAFAYPGPTASPAHSRRGASSANRSASVMPSVTSESFSFLAPPNPSSFIGTQPPRRMASPNRHTGSPHPSLSQHRPLGPPSHAHVHSRAPSHHSDGSRSGAVPMPTPVVDGRLSAGLSADVADGVPAAVVTTTTPRPRSQSRASASLRQRSRSSSRGSVRSGEGRKSRHKSKGKGKSKSKGKARKRHRFSRAYSPASEHHFPSGPSHVAPTKIGDDPVPDFPAGELWVRFKRWWRRINGLPWVADERVTIDYVPEEGDGGRARKRRRSTWANHHRERRRARRRRRDRDREYNSDEETASSATPLGPSWYNFGRARSKRNGKESDLLSSGSNPTKSNTTTTTTTATTATATTSPLREKSAEAQINGNVEQHSGTWVVYPYQAQLAVKAAMTNPNPVLAKTALGHPVIGVNSNAHAAPPALPDLTRSSSRTGEGSSTPNPPAGTQRHTQRHRPHHKSHSQSQSQSQSRRPQGQAQAQDRPLAPPTTNSTPTPRIPPPYDGTAGRIYFPFPVETETTSAGVEIYKDTRTGNKYVIPVVLGAEVGPSAVAALGRGPGTRAGAGANTGARPKTNGQVYPGGYVRA